MTPDRHDPAGVDFAPARTGFIVTALIAAQLSAVLLSAIGAAAEVRTVDVVRASSATPRVAAVPSDDAALPTPQARTDSLTGDQVLEMVRLAVDRVGGMGRYVPPEARTVALKPNITIARVSGSGVITDTRVVRAVALLVHEVAPQAKVLIAEAGAGWVDPAFQDCTLVEIRGGDTYFEDGWEIAGHRATVAELRSLGVDAEIVDLNFDAVDTLRIEGGGFAADEYLLPQTITRADAWINLPVAKPHGAKITACIKNRFGILPGWIYGWGRSSGTSRHGPIQHNPQIVDETLVDIYSVAPEDLCVCDLIHNTDGSAFTGAPRRSNVVVAGSDPVSTDLVVGRVMGFNPDDFEFAELAWQRGLGPRFVERIDLASDVATVSPRFTKAGRDYGGDWSQQADYGMGPRRWLLLGPLPRDHAFNEAQVRTLRPRPEEEGWSQTVAFGHDRIDLDRYFDDPVHCAVYAYTTFTMARSDSVRFWLGSDEGMTVWLDGESIYHHEGRRQHRLGSERLPGYVAAGQHRLLVRADQGRGRFDFSINVCEPIDDERFAGNRYPGVRYAGESADAPRAGERLAAINQWDSGDNPDQYSVVAIAGVEEPLEAAAQAPDSVYLELPAPRSLHFLDAAATAAGQPPLLADTAAMRALHQSHTWFAHLPLGHSWYPERWPDVDRYLSWAGLDAGISFGYGGGEARRTAVGWMAQGLPAVLGFGHDWYVAHAYRTSAAGQEFFYTEPDTAYWEDADYHDFWGRLPNGHWVNTPVVAVRRGAAPIPAAAVGDSLAVILLDNALVADVELDSLDWGSRRCPVGLAAWDAWVIEWERLPWTRQWALGEWERESLQDLRDLYEYIAGNHRALGEVFPALAAGAGDPAGAADARHAAAFTEAGAHFAVAAAGIDSLRALLFEEQGGDLSPADSARVERLAETRAWPRRVRSEIRAALSSLAALSGRQLPPAAEDPLRHRDRGRRLVTWSADYSKGVHELLVTRQGSSWQTVDGHTPEGAQLTEHAPLPAGGGWEVVVEPVSGHGLYGVVAPPAGAATDRLPDTVRVRIDDDWAGYLNPVELVVWAVPREGGAPRR